MKKIGILSKMFTVVTKNFPTGRLKADLVMVEEGQEPKDMCALIGDKTSYDSLLNGKIGFSCSGLYRKRG